MPAKTAKRDWWFALHVASVVKGPTSSQNAVRGPLQTKKSLGGLGGHGGLGAKNKGSRTRLLCLSPEPVEQPSVYAAWGCVTDGASVDAHDRDELPDARRDEHLFECA